MPCLHLFVCFVCLLTLFSPNGKPQATAQGTQCVGEQVNATRSYRSCPQCYKHTHTHTLSISSHSAPRKQERCSLQETKTIYKTGQRCEMLTRHGLGAVLSLGHCHF